MKLKFPKTIVGFFLISIISLSVVSSIYAATISGTVAYEGEAPTFKEVKMDADPICLSHHSGPVYPETLVLGENNAMGNVFVYVKNPPNQQYSAPQEPVVIDQKGCQYSPHVVGLMVGQPVKILNPDGTLHNVHALSKVNEEFNSAMPKFRTEITKIFDKPEFMFPMKCDVHPWMGAWISVMAHPFFNVSGTDGKFTIANLPAGTYEIEAWHEKLGTQAASVTVAGDENKEISFKFSKPSK